MLDVTVRVTKTSTHLEQIHHIAIVNKGQFGQGSALYLYAVYVDGTPLEHLVSHCRSDGALALLQAALERYEEEQRFEQEREGKRAHRD
jgi:hypothetical protein